jgi:hypothetical protein
MSVHLHKNPWKLDFPVHGELYGYGYSLDPEEYECHAAGDNKQTSKVVIIWEGNPKNRFKVLPLIFRLMIELKFQPKISDGRTGIPTKRKW